MSKRIYCKCCNCLYLEEDMSKNDKDMCCSCWCYTRPMEIKIQDLEHRLANSIEPKFKIGQEVWFIDPEKDVSKGEIWNIELISNQIMYSVFWGNDYEDVYYQYELFATEEEAKAKLREMQDE